MSSPPSERVTPELRLPHGGPALPRRLRILSLGGGGYRGLFTASVLARLEAYFSPRTLHQCFDVFSGTSIGGLLATGLAIGVPAATLHEQLKLCGPEVFPRRRFSALRQLFGNAFQAEPLAKAITACLGNAANQPIRNVEKALLVTSVNWVAGGPTLFRSAALGATLASDETLLDICLATSAAPTYFPAHILGGAPMIDGGLIANNPDALALFEVLRRWPTALPDIEMLSVGTAGVGSGGMSGAAPGSLLGWAGTLIPFMISAQERLAAMQAQALLQSRYVRLNHTPGPKMKALSELAVVDASMTDTLEALAAEECARAIANQLPDLTRLFA